MLRCGAGARHTPTITRTHPLPGLVQCSKANPSHAKQVQQISREPSNTSRNGRHSGLPAV